MDNFYNKNVLITGKSLGLVRELARQLTKEKANIILLSDNKKEVAGIESEIDKMRGRISVYLLDLASEKSIDKMVDRIIRDNDRIDVIINSGSLAKNITFFESNLDTIKINLKDNSFNGMLITRYFLPYMISCGKGYIINIGPDLNNDIFSAINNAALKAFSNSLVKYLKENGQKEIGSMYVENAGKKGTDDQNAIKIIAAVKKNKTEIKL